MVREVDLVSYLPPFLSDYKETNITLTAENPEFILVWKAADQTLKNEFIETADEYGISKFEKLLNIIPSHNDTLENRRARIQFRWFTMLPYTWRMLIQKLTALCGENDFIITKQFNFYRIDLDVCLELFGQVEELERIIETMLPCNMVMNARNSILINAECAARALSGAYLAPCYLITNDWKEKKTVEGATLIGSGIIETQNRIVSNDWKEKKIAEGATLIGSGIVETQNRIVTNDWKENVPVKGFSFNGAATSNTVNVVIMETFKEQLIVNGNGSAGLGIATTECIEIN